MFQVLLYGNPEHPANRPVAGYGHSDGMGKRYGVIHRPDFWPFRGQMSTSRHVPAQLSADSFRQLLVDVDNFPGSIFLPQNKFLKFSVLHKRMALHSEIPFCRRTDRFRLLYGQALHKPAELLPGQRAYLRRGARPLETPAVQTFLQQDKAGSVKVQRFQGIVFPAAEKIHCVSIGVHLVCVPDDRHQPVE